MSTTWNILDLGNCDMDHGSILRLLEPLSATVVRAHSAFEADSLLEKGDFDLILVNRILDRDGDSGIEFIRRICASREQSRPSLMLISNYEDAQDEAVAAGAELGFGKSQLGEAATIERIQNALESAAPNETGL